MTRKRFIKLLMSKGHSRNEAILLAKRAQNAGHSYQSYYAYTRPMRVAICSKRGFEKAIQTYCKYLKKSLELLGGEFTRIAHTLQIGSRVTHLQS